MPRTADHIVACHELAARRHALRQPMWAHELDVSDVFHDDALTFEQSRDEIVRRLKATPWVRDTGEFSDLTQVVELLEYSEDVDGFDAHWDELYDEADYDRVWIKTS